MEYLKTRPAGASFKWSFTLISQGWYAWLNARGFNHFLQYNTAPPGSNNYKVQPGETVTLMFIVADRSAEVYNVKILDPCTQPGDDILGTPVLSSTDKDTGLSDRVYTGVPEPLLTSVTLYQANSNCGGIISYGLVDNSGSVTVINTRRDLLKSFLNGDNAARTPEAALIVVQAPGKKPFYWSVGTSGGG